MAYGTITSGWSDQEIIFRYERLLAQHKGSGNCFTCGAVRTLVNALVAGPCDESVALNPRPAIIGCGHSVCRSCIKRGEAIALR